MKRLLCFFVAGKYAPLFVCNLATSTCQISFVDGPTQKTPGSAKKGSQNPRKNTIFPDLRGSFGKAQTKRNFTTSTRCNTKFHIDAATQRQTEARRQGQTDLFITKQSIMSCQAR